MTDLGLMKYFLGLEVRHGKSGIFVSQKGYAKDILKKNKMEECNSVATSRYKTLFSLREEIV